MNNLDVLNLPIFGINLIEAAAGTGKTYTLIILYIRLLLNLEEKSTFLRPLTVKEILVVTFTNTATQELKYKIKKNIHQLRIDCIRGYSNNDLFSQILLKINNIKQAIIQLSNAEREINQASIFTIHGFCKKILTENTIESKVLFDLSITNNEKQLYKKICIDFWRQHFYSLPLNIASLIKEIWNNPQNLLNDISPYIYGKIPNICYPDIYAKNINITEYYTLILEHIKQIKTTWQTNKNDIIAIISSCKINRKIYNKNLINQIHIINKWSQQSTIDHIVPNELKYFRTSIIKKYCHDHSTIKIIPLFNAIEHLYQQLLSFKPLLFRTAIYNIRLKLNNIKYSRSEITFNDLIDILCKTLIRDKDNILKHIIRTYYPIAIIDEFQDTDQQQYKIFQILYSNQEKNSLILIGDPKQSIYAFRGANIFMYMKIRKKIYNKYNLNINWRASPNMVNAINTLFQFTSNPFIFKNIPFLPSLVAQRNKKYKFCINDKPQTSMCFWLHHSNTIITENNKKQIMAQICANNLHTLLSEINSKTAWIENEYHKRILKSSDITILVRDYEEASIINSALLKLNISTIFLSEKKNIFETIEAYELLLLLKAIFFLDNHMISVALTTLFFNLNASDIENIINDGTKWEQIVQQFLEYFYIWKNKGIYLMIYKIIFDYKTSESLLLQKYGENKLINILHLGELLQDASKQLTNEYELLQWITHNIDNPKKEISNQLLRINNDNQFIKISTIHKSKGLEFPITFIPFMFNLKNYKKNSLFHDRKKYTAHLNFNKSEQYLKLAYEEHLSENLRLLYVAVTRSIYHCAIGITSTIHKHKKQYQEINNFYSNALGYLIQQKEFNDLEFLKQKLQELSNHSNGDINFHIISQSSRKNPIFLAKKQSNHILQAKIFTQSINIKPNITTSYSELIKEHYIPKDFNLQQYFNLKIDKNIFFQKDSNQLSIHNFPKGKECGIFFHDIFKNLNFNQPIDTQWLQKYIDKYNFNPNWTPIIQKWISIILNTPLNNTKLTLSQITSYNKQSELQFHLPINKNITLQKLNYLCKKYDPLSYQSTPLTFNQIKGILKGFIDLIFCWNNKYYLLDYKTNWLGVDNNAYTYDNIIQEMIKCHYALQYQLYSLALHRFLRYRIANYNYEKNFGGIYYLFIRGINTKIKNNNGIYFCRPLSKFIDKLDTLFC